jgi:hypothetical protein
VQAISAVVLEGGGGGSAELHVTRCIELAPLVRFSLGAGDRGRGSGATRWFSAFAAGRLIFIQ